MKFLILSFISLMAFSIAAQTTQINIQNAAQAQKYTKELSVEMKELAGLYQQNSPKACDAYKAYMNKLNSTKVIGNFNLSSRLVYRINMYKESGADVDYTLICKQKFDKYLYNFLIDNSKSLAKFTF